MEPTGLALDFVGVTLSLIQRTEEIIRALKQWKDTSGETAHLLTEVELLSETLLTARDLAEREGTEDARVQTLAALAQQGQDLEALLRELEISARRPNRFRHKRLLNQAWNTQILEEIKDRRRVLDELLYTSGISRSTDISDQLGREASSRPSVEVVTEWLRGPDFSDMLHNLEQRYIAGTGSWLLDESLFKRWMEEPGKSLWCTGQREFPDSGTGKSILWHLRQKLPMSKTPVIFAFFSFKSQTQKPTDIVNSLISQLVWQSHDLSKTLAGLYNKHKSSSTSPHLEELWVCLSSEMTRFDRVFVFFDALDEYPHGPEGFLSDFHHLLEIPNTSLFVTSRPTFRNKTALSAFEVLEVRIQDSDIEDYVREKLSRSWLADQRSLHDDIVRRTIKESNGMPLTLNQLREAVGIQLGSDELDEDDLPFIDAVREVCSGPMFTEQSRQQVALVHYSLNEYLQQYLLKVMYLIPGSDEPEVFITKKCLTYLCFNTFACDIPSKPGELEDRLTRYSMLGYAARYWGEHAQRVPSPNMTSDIMALFNSSHNTLSAGLAMSTYEQHPSHYEQAYRGMLGLHISAYFGLTDVAKHVITVQKVHPDATTSGGWTALHWAARRGWTTMVSTLLSYSATPSRTTTLDGWNPLHLAAKEGHVDIAQELITRVDINAKDVHSRTALYLATWGGHADVVRCLLDALADPKIPNAYGATALHCAAKRGHELIVDELLSKDVDVNAVDQVGLTALDEAVRKQNKKVIKRLTEAGAETRWNTNMLSIDSTIHDLDWSAYKVNKEKTEQLQKGNQAKCHILEKAPEYESLSLSAMVFRKTFSLSADIQRRKYFQSEHMILHRLRHPNVVTCLDFDEDPDQDAFLLYMEYCDLGDLKTSHGRPLNTEPDDDDNDDEDDTENAGRDFGFYAEDSSSKDETTALDSQSIWTLAAQLSLALAYLHYGLALRIRNGHWEASFERSWQNVIHRDIKPANVVMQSYESHARIYKLCDLGIASEAGKGSEYNTTQLIGSEGFLPPEVNCGNCWSTKGDVWSLGACANQSFSATIREVKKLKDTRLEDSTKGMIDKCTHNAPNKRPNSLEILEQAHDLLEKNDLLNRLPHPSRLQIQAVHGLLGGHEGGYILQSFNLVAELLDDIAPFHNQGAKDRRKGTLKRLKLLWKDGAEAPFLKHLNDFSLHILVVLPLPPKTRAKHIQNAITSARVNTRWKRSRWTPLHLAVQEGNKDIVAELLRNWADRDKEDIHGYIPRHYTGSQSSIQPML
ncbi:nacht and ankyrin domain protein [Fusarium avenaceum]|nr:nacht and ankyrin domain protein [Fusarium avenaceum]